MHKISARIGPGNVIWGHSVRLIVNAISYDLKTLSLVFLDDYFRDNLPKLITFCVDYIKCVKTT